MKYTLLLLALFASVSTTAQKVFKCYGCIPEAVKTQIFFDDFDQWDEDWFANAPYKYEYNVDESNWPDTIWAVHKGYLICSFTDSLPDGSVARTNARILDIDYDKNFEIEISALVVPLGEERNAQGLLVWGAAYVDARIGQYFNYTNKGRVYCSPGIDREDFRKRDARKLYTPFVEGFCTYTIRKVKDQYYIFIDKKFEGKLPYVPLTGKYIGLGASIGSFVKVDYIKVSYLPGEIEIR